MCLGIAEVDADLEKKRVIIKGNIDIGQLITTFKDNIKMDAELIYYKEGGWEDHNRPTENCDKKENGCFRSCDQDEVQGIGAKYHEKRNMFKDHDRKKQSRGRKDKQGFCDDDKAQVVGADHYKIRNTFKDHKPEAYVPPKQEVFWGDARSGMHQKFPSIPGVGSRFTTGFPNYQGLYY